MKSKLFFLSVFLLLTLSSCSEKLTCKILSPESDAKFNKGEAIYVSVEASTNKGSILQVQIYIDEDQDHPKSFTEPPYEYTIFPDTLSLGFHSISAAAYSSEGNREVAAIYIKIVEPEKGGE